MPKRRLTAPIGCYGPGGCQVGRCLGNGPPLRFLSPMRLESAPNLPQSLARPVQPVMRAIPDRAVEAGMAPPGVAPVGAAAAAPAAAPDASGTLDRARAALLA